VLFADWIVVLIAKIYPLFSCNPYPGMCDFKSLSIMGLGAIFELGGNSIDPEKAKHLANWTVYMHCCNAFII
jgi:hypothetical protein